MYLRVTVTPGAKKESVEECGETELALSVREPAKQNLANRRVVQLVAERYGVPERAVRIISGHRSPRKMLSIDTP